MDDTKGPSCAAAQLNLQGADMGWWGFLTFSKGSYFATTPDELEYMASRAVGYGANPNLETTFQTLVANGRTMEAFHRMQPWWQLNVTNSVKQQLRQKGIDFNLAVEKSSGGEQMQGVITPIRVHPAHVAEPGRSDTLSWD